MEFPKYIYNYNHKDYKKCIRICIVPCKMYEMYCKTLEVKGRFYLESTHILKQMNQIIFLNLKISLQKGLKFA